jgi:hypothetical protein
MSKIKQKEIITITIKQLVNDFDMRQIRRALESGFETHFSKENFTVEWQRKPLTNEPKKEKQA